MRIVLAALLLILLGQAGKAQDAGLTGCVLDTLEKKALRQAVVALLHTCGLPGPISATPESRLF